ncbi:hypothetical protein FACS1894184_04830 [Clostridia bacterium]|nr:hypothetical protein FACS1894184_04830 [Clostridia bacterium]
MNRQTKRRAILRIALAVCVVTLAVSVSMYIKYMVGSRDERALFSELSDLRDAGLRELTDSPPTESTPDFTGEVFVDTSNSIRMIKVASTSPTIPRQDSAAPALDILPQYQLLHERNADMIGWLTIPGTVIDYPVMQSPDAPGFYLTHDFDRRKRKSGVPFAQENCDVNASDNIILHGHHLKDGTQFAKLLSYQKEPFYQTHQTILFDTLYEKREFVVIAAFKISGSAKDPFEYTQFVNAQNDAEFDAFVERCKSLAFYDTGATASYGDKLLTLSTCEYSLRDGLFVVVAKQVMLEQVVLE